MSGMFGAPIGISAAEQDQRQNILGATQAMEALGRIGMQPAETRLRTAQADAAEAAARERKQMEELAAGVARARTAAAAGRTLTVADEPRARPSMAQPLLDLLAAGEAQGTSPVLLAPYAKQAAEIQQKEASTASARAEEVKRKLDAEQKKAELIGSFAMAGLQGPQQYAQALMQLEAQGIPTDAFPRDWRQAVPMLKGAVAQSMEAKEKIDRDRMQVHEDGQQKRWNAQNAESDARIATTKARTELIKTRTDALKKAGGAGSKEETEGQKELRLARKAAREAKERKEFPPMPLDPKDISFTVGKSFTDKQGRKLTMVGRDADGLPTFSLARSSLPDTPLDEVDSTTLEEDDAN